MGGFFFQGLETVKRDDDGSATYPGAIPPPPGVTPNLDDPVDAGHSALFISYTVCIVICTLLFFLRTAVKCCIVRHSFLEDVTCTIAWVLTVLFALTVFFMYHYGGGYHAWEISPENYVQIVKWSYASSITYCPAAFFTKATLLLLIARVFAIEQHLSRGIYSFIIFIFILYLPIQIVKTVICLPIHAVWDTSVPGHCMNQRLVFVVDLCVAMITDIVILMLPIALAWRLHFPWKTKLKIMVLLGAGGGAIATTAYRMVKIVQYLHSTDPSADLVALDISTIVELALGLICACLPAINILFQHRPKPHSGENSPSNSKPRSWFSWSGRMFSVSTVATSGEPMKQRPMNFETELAILTGDRRNSGGTGTEEDRPRTPASQEDWVISGRANSIDGRREGWLSQEVESQPKQSSHVASIGYTSDESRLTAGNLSMELARVSGNRPWNRIFDGTCNSSPSPS